MIIQLQQIPLYIAGRYRDLNSSWELPLAGQMLALAQIAVLWFPNILASSLYLVLGGAQPDYLIKCVVIFLILLAVWPLVKIIRFEAAQRRVISSKKQQDL